MAMHASDSLLNLHVFHTECLVCTLINWLINSSISFPAPVNFLVLLLFSTEISLLYSRSAVTLLPKYVTVNLSTFSISFSSTEIIFFSRCFQTPTFLSCQCLLVIHIVFPLQLTDLQILLSSLHLFQSKSHPMH